MKPVVKKWLKDQSTEFYGAGIHGLILRWNIAIEGNGGKLGMGSTEDQLNFYV